MKSVFAVWALASTLAFWQAAEKPFDGGPYNPKWPWDYRSLAQIRDISAEEMSAYGWIMTMHHKWTGLLLSSCHYGKVRLPSSPSQRENYKARTWMDWYSTGGDTYINTAVHCVFNMRDKKPWTYQDALVIRSLKRLTENQQIVFKTIDNPPVLERSEFDEVSIWPLPVVVRTCLQHVSENIAHCFELKWRTYPNGKYGQRELFYEIRWVESIIEKTGRNCKSILDGSKNTDSFAGMSGMTVVDYRGNAYGVVSNWFRSLCEFKELGWVNAPLRIEPLRNTAYSDPGSVGKSIIVEN